MSDEQKDPAVEQERTAETQLYPSGQSSDSPASTLKHTSPGQMLRSARTAKDMSVEELTGHTMLSRATVHALEENDFGRLSQPVFVRGYYRKCAKILGISEDEIMQAYSAWTGVDGPKPASPRQVDVVPQDVTPGGMRVVGILLLALGVLAAIALGWSFLPDANDAATTNSESAAVVDDQANADAAIEDVPATQVQTVAAPESDSDILSSDATIANPEQAQPSNSAAATPVAQTTEEDRQTSQAASDIPQGLYLKFDQRSWVDIRTASNKRVLGGVIEAGAEHTFPAKDAPYDVRLGYARGVELYVNSKRFDLASETGPDNTARFTLDVP